jgi:hypothetical protein
MSQEHEPIDPPALTPPTGATPAPVVPLAYAQGDMPRESKVGQQIAKASWVAPIMALLLGMCTGSLRNSDRSVGMFMGLFNLGLILLGFVLAIVALSNIKRWGRTGVLGNAIGGLVVSGALMALILMLIPSLIRARTVAAQQATAAAAAARQQQAAQLRKQGEDAFLREGWFGIYNDGTIIVTISAMAPDEGMAKEMLDNLGEPHHFAIVAIRNGSDETITADTRRAIIYLDDNTHEPAPDPIAVLSTAKTERESALRVFGPPYTIEPRAELTKGILFFPDNVKPERMTHVTIYVNGHAMDVPGRVFSAAEKKQLHESGKRTQAEM